MLSLEWALLFAKRCFTIDRGCRIQLKLDQGPVVPKLDSAIQRLNNCGQVLAEEN